MRPCSLFCPSRNQALPAGPATASSSHGIHNAVLQPMQRIQIRCSAPRLPVSLRARKAAVVDESGEAPVKKRASRKKVADPEASEGADAVVKQKRTRKPKAAVEEVEPEADMEEEEQPGPAPPPLTYVQPMEPPAGLDTATSVLEQSVIRRKAGRPRQADVDKQAADEEAARAVAAEAEAAREITGMESDDRTTVSEEVKAGLLIVEPTAGFVATLPPQFYATNWADQTYIDALESQHYWETRRAEAKVLEEYAWEVQHHQNRYAVNRYAMVNRVARIMAEVENHDFARGIDAPQHVPPWARAEIMFGKEFDAFNDYLAENMDKLTKQLPKEAEEAQLDILDDALFLLSREDDNNAVNRRVDQQTEDHLLVDRYLDNILPGVSLSSLSEAYADDIFAGDDEEYFPDDDMTGAGVKAGAGSDDDMDAEASMDEDGKPKKKEKGPKKGRGRPKKAVEVEE